MTSIKINKLGLYRNQKWLFQNLNLVIPKGSLVAILGPSGVGKSSLLSCLSGSEKPTEGEIKYNINETEIKTPHNISPNLGIIFQHLRLTEHVTVLDNVIYGRIANYGLKETIFGFPENDRIRAYAILKDLGIEHLAYINGHPRHLEVNNRELQLHEPLSKPTVHLLQTNQFPTWIHTTQVELWDFLGNWFPRKIELFSVPFTIQNLYRDSQIMR